MGCPREALAERAQGAELKRHTKCNLGRTSFPGPGIASWLGREIALAHRPVLAGIVKPPQPMPAPNGAV